MEYKLDFVLDVPEKGFNQSLFEAQLILAASEQGAMIGGSLVPFEPNRFKRAWDHIKEAFIALFYGA